ncbi:MAG: CBS domain-containing protein [Syntrophales bacterium]|jgi:sporulation protein YlmC with PRC-barrel domain/CBS domain-containing protein|nr:CBS domain-containing protein [Syntrophales bacterium]
MANMIPNQQNSELFIFFSELLGKKIIDPRGNSVGRLLDLIVNIDETYPHVTGARLRLEKNRKIRLFSSQGFYFTDGHFTASFADDDLPPDKELAASELMLKEALLDKQVVDTDGAKIRRVNDLQFLIANNELYLVHVDVGFHGLLRRVGLKPLFGFVLRALFDYEMSDQLISWKFVQMISSPDLLQLTIAQNRLGQLHPADLADIIEDLDIHQRKAVFNALDVETAAETLEETDPKVQVSLIEGLSTEDASDIIEEMSLSEAADLLGDLSPEKVEGILNEMEKDAADDMKELLAHPEEKAGGLMTTAYPSFSPNCTVAEALQAIRADADDLDLIYYSYVVDEQEHILGVVSLRELLAAEPEASLSGIMDTRVIFVNVEEKKRQIADDFFKYGLLAIPVVDDDEQLKGVILFKNLLEVIAAKLGR